jgi:hypothetical protein
MNTPIRPFRQFDAGHGSPFPAVPLWGHSAEPTTHESPFFRIAGPSGYQGWGWTTTSGTNTSFTQYNDNRGGHFSLWRQGNYYRFQ